MSVVTVLAQLLLPRATAAIEDVTRSQSSTFERAIPTQLAHARSVGLQRSLTGRTGSEDWADQSAAGWRSEGPILPAVTSPDGRSRVPWPVGMFRPHLPAGLVEGRGTGYLTDAYNKGWVDISQAGRPSWGESAGLASSRPNVQRATLLEPTDRTPPPRTVQAAYRQANDGRSRLADMFGD